MAGAYLEIWPQDSYSFTTNVTVSNVAQDLTGSTIWFTSYQTGFENANVNPLFNINSADTGNTVANIVISNGVGISTNSLVTITLASSYTNGLSAVNSASWTIVAKTSAGKVYTLDRGRLAVRSNPTVSYQ